jgi:hypothetical protein
MYATISYSAGLFCVRIIPSMAQVFIKVEEESPCNHCGAMAPLDVQAYIEYATCPSCGKELYPRLTAATLYQRLFDGDVIDARRGGLVLGRDTPEDDIPMIVPVNTGVYQIIGLMQGGEYILNAEVSTRRRERLEEIAAESKGDYEPLGSIELTKVTRIINTNHQPGGEVILLIDRGQFIVSRAGAAKFYRELEELNNSA